MDGNLIEADAPKNSVAKTDPEMVGRLREAWGATEAKLDLRWFLLGARAY